MPRYQQIAIEMAERIANNRYEVGQKIHARSTLASTFGVSPETARKAVNVLVDLGIMQVKHGSGVFVASKEKAEELLKQHQDVQSIDELKIEAIDSIKKQQEELQQLTDIIDTLIVQTKKMNHTNPFIPAELILTSEAEHLEQTVSDLNLWHETSATIIAISHDNELLLSPGPYAKIQANDTLFFIGDELAKQKMQNYFYPHK